MIGCPQYGKLVRGSYKCDERGAYKLAPDGQFLLQFARCSQQDGRCMETLCALHRYNRRGLGTWYPDRLLAMPDRRAAPRRGKQRTPPPNDGGSLSIEV